MRWEAEWSATVNEDAQIVVTIRGKGDDAPNVDPIVMPRELSLAIARELIAKREAEAGAELPANREINR